MKLSEITVAPMRVVGMILLIIAWGMGIIRGLEAWIFLLLLLDLKFKIKL